MADYDNRVLGGQVAGTGVMDMGLRAYMLRVYNYMLIGLGITGVTAYGAFMAAVTNDPSAAAAKLHNGMMLTSFGLRESISPTRF